MSDVSVPEDVPSPNGPIQQVTPDDLVEQTLERAATKVASVTAPGGPPVLNRGEAIVCVLVLVILNLAALFVGLQTRGDTRGHREDFQIVCQLLVEQVPPESAKEVAAQLADCLK
jgi:hypothetical protein